MLSNYLLTVQCSASVLMGLFWLLQVKQKDASLVDFVWILSIFSAIVYVFIDIGNYSNRHFLIFVLGAFWSARLSTFLLLRIMRSKDEDSRYQTMRASMGNYQHLGFFIFYQAQSVFVTIFTLPITASLLTKASSIGTLDIIGALFFASALLGESIADNQLSKFKQQHKGLRKTCDVGLWYYSRHPNYFFEWLHWFAYPFFTYGTEYFYICVFAPFVMLVFLLKLTGIPHVEREALKNKPDYKDYVATTSAFIPWFKFKEK